MTKQYCTELYPTDADDDIGHAGNFCVYEAADVDAILRQREKDFTMAEDERIEAVRRYEVAEQQLAAMTAERDNLRLRIHAVDAHLATQREELKRLREICEDATEEVIEYANVSGIPSGKPTEPSLPESIRQMKSDHGRLVATLQAELEGAYVAIKALLHMAERAKPTKLIGALAWVENDEYARKLASDVLNKQPADHSRLYEELTTITQQLAAREGQIARLHKYIVNHHREGTFDGACRFCMQQDTGKDFVCVYHEAQQALTKAGATREQQRQEIEELKWSEDESLPPL